MFIALNLRSNATLKPLQYMHMIPMLERAWLKAFIVERNKARWKSEGIIPFTCAQFWTKLHDDKARADMFATAHSPASAEEPTTTDGTATREASTGAATSTITTPWSASSGMIIAALERQLFRPTRPTDPVRGAHQETLPERRPCSWLSNMLLLAMLLLVTLLLVMPLLAMLLLVILQTSRSLQGTRSSKKALMSWLHTWHGQQRR